MKFVKKYSRLSVPMFLPYGKIMVSPNHVYLFSLTSGGFVSYTHKEFFRDCPFVRFEFVEFVRKTFKIVDFNHFL